MSKALLAGSALAILLALAACSRRPQTGDEASPAPTPAPVQRAPAPISKPTTETASFSSSDEGAYGMPRAPIPYDQLSRYERQQEVLGGGRAPQDDADAAPAPAPAYREPAKRLNPKTRRESDAVFY
jgi:hypothetical protein